MKNIVDFFSKHINFEFQNVTWIGIITALALVPVSNYFPESYGYENGLIENIQLVILFLGLYFSLNTKTDKKFFYFIALVIGILLIREVNCGRTIFFPIPGEVNQFYRWSEIKYGWLAHPIFGAYIAFVGFYFFKNKLFITLWEKIKNIKFPIWNFLLLLAGMAIGLYAEEIHHLVMEEYAELLFYVALIGFIYLYSQDKKFLNS